LHVNWWSERDDETANPMMAGNVLCSDEFLFVVVEIGMSADVDV